MAGLRGLLSVLLMAALAGCVTGGGKRTSQTYVLGEQARDGVTSGGKRVKHISEAPLDVQTFVWGNQARDALSKADPDGVVSAMQKAIEAARARNDADKEAELRERLAGMLISGGWPDRARDVLNEAVLIAETGRRHAAAASALVMLAKLDLRQGNSGSATGRLQGAVAKYDLAEADYGAVNTRLMLARLLLYVDPPRAVAVLEEAHARAAGKDTSAFLSLRLQTAMTLSDAGFAVRNSEAGNRYLAEAKALAEANPKQLGGYRVAILVAQARAAAREGDLEATDRLLASAAGLVDDPGHPVFNRSAELTRLADRIWALGYVDAAWQVARRAADIIDNEAAKAKDPKKLSFGLLDGGVAAPFVQLGEIDRGRGRFAAAAQAFRRGLELLPESDTPDRMSSFLAGVLPEGDAVWRMRVRAEIGLGRVSEATGDAAAAIGHFERALATARRRDDFGLAAAAEIGLARVRGDKAANKALAARYAVWAQSRDAANEAQQAAVLMDLALLVEPDDERVATWLGVKAMEANAKAGGTLATYIEGQRLFGRLLAKRDPERSRAHAEHADEAQKRMDLRANRVVPIAWGPLSVPKAGS
ncbi:MAG: hypothetical protein RLO51_27750 [Thalassobaculum sp.]|uniref:hypothetical protein n=1 Tax=Thalassobaculum sp. TaxID=2022740 RepID=UPI0032EC6199